ncbi:class I SAM-dependent methyltransferase [Amycolatopsis pigmentata]|uniref:S-adenosyl-L-methionine-dependent methyltransferase n=1 Tax=Amycolatopsis pigmentata TaxID=450801 RepID=A0ABW5G5H6_9PSEU
MNREPSATREPSKTALTAAAARAAHLLVDAEPYLFADPLAAPLLGDKAGELLGYHLRSGAHPLLSAARVQVTTRSRYAEERLAEAVARGVGQYVILGAGLDTFAYRTDLPVRVFEVDHPAGQEWKRQALQHSGTALPESVSFVGVDFSVAVTEDDPQALVKQLAEHGFDPERPSFFSWLGVTMYLTRESVAATLAHLPPGAEIVATYILPPEMRDEGGSAYADAIAPIAAQSGEPWLSYFAPDEMSELLTVAGFGHITHASERDSVDPALWDRTDTLVPERLSQLVHARS